MTSRAAKLTWSQRLLLAAVAFSPFQWALTLNVGFPLKLSEVFLAGGIALHVVGRRERRRLRVEGMVVLALGAVLVASTIHAVTSAAPLEVLRGYDRPLLQDTLMYCGYGLLVLFAWSPLRALPRQAMGRALVVASWLMGLATLAQAVLLRAGQDALLQALNFTVVGTGDDLFGSTSGVRSGPFLEGQHLGFVAGALVLVCVGRKAWLASLWSAWCVLYSQSTTALLGLAFAVLTVLIIRRSVKTLLASISVVLVATFIALRVETVRDYATFQLAKLGLFGLQDNYDWATLSLDLRSVKTGVGLRLGMDHPVLGVGPGRYGAYFFGDEATLDLPSYYYEGTHRAIAENAYAHIAAELGLVGLILFGALVLITVLRTLSAPAHVTAVAAFVAVGVASQSSWTFIPIWVLLAYCLATARDQGVPEAPERLHQESGPPPGGPPGFAPTGVPGSGAHDAEGVAPGHARHAEAVGGGTDRRFTLPAGLLSNSP